MSTTPTFFPMRYSSLKPAFIIFQKASGVENASRLLSTHGTSTMGLSIGILNRTNYSSLAGTGADVATTGTFIVACNFELCNGKVDLCYQV